MYVRDWSKYETFFSRTEFECSHTGVCKMEEYFMDCLYSLRFAAKFPFIVTSGYRAATHPIEAKKEAPGEHYYGRACDIAVNGHQAYIILSLAPSYNFTRIGISKKSGQQKGFIHLGTSLKKHGFASPTLWTY